jgi:hypothetical protein
MTVALRFGWWSPPGRLREKSPTMTTTTLCVAPRSVGSYMRVRNFWNGGTMSWSI